MKSLRVGGAFLLATAFINSAPLAAQIVGSARQLAKGTLETTIYYQGTSRQHLTFSVGNAANCAGGSSAAASVIIFPCTSTGDQDARGTGDALMIKFNYQPSERGLQLYTTVGVGEYHVTVGTVTVFDSAIQDKAGFLTSVGAKAVFIPDTIVSPAFALDASVGWQRYFGTARLDLLQLQLALETGHRFKFKDPEFSIEPYGGVKWLRTQAHLKDLATGDQSGGRQNSVSPFIGVKIPFFENDSLFGEVSFVHGVQYSSGLMIRFK